MTTLNYNGITDQALRDEYGKLGRKDRTVENMLSMTVSRELYKDIAMAYANISNIAIHAIKSFLKKLKPVSNKRVQNECNKCGRSDDVAKSSAKRKHVLHVKE